MYSSEGGDQYQDRLNSSINAEDLGKNIYHKAKKPIPHIELDGQLDELIRVPTGVRNENQTLSSIMTHNDTQKQQFNQSSMMSMY